MDARGIIRGIGGRRDEVLRGYCRKNSAHEKDILTKQTPYLCPKCKSTHSVFTLHERRHRLFHVIIDSLVHTIESFPGRWKCSLCNGNTIPKSTLYRHLKIDGATRLKLGISHEMTYPLTNSLPTSWQSPTKPPKAISVSSALSVLNFTPQPTQN